MATSGTPRPAGPRPLSAVLDDAWRQVQAGAPDAALPAPPAAPSVPAFQDGFLYSGNRQESVPRALFLDRRLTPLERNAWQVFRLQLQGDGLTALPTYEQLRPYLSAMPCGPKASTETVARALTLLRLTRWLSLVRRRRDPRTGRILGNLYVLHDEPLTPFEAMQLDAGYLGLVSQALTHASKAVQQVGLHTLQEIAEDPLLNGRVLPTRLQVLADRLACGGMDALHGTETCPQEAPSHESEGGVDDRLRMADAPASDSEAGRQTASQAPLRNPKQDRTVRSSSLSEIRTVPRVQARTDLRLPALFLRLKDEQQAGALVALEQVPAAQRQAVVDEWAARCRDSAVRNPAGYLFGIIQKALRGEFNAWAGARGGTDGGAPATAPSPPAAPPPPAAPRPASREVVQAHLDRLRAILRSP
ncbi:STY4528 family pathogenicity island replication protein [Acidovorax sp. SUPP2539]|uniref:STY4528 family pathogenicity island replication protein n=1 Tax=Acidovorax sp. SUPP2539 TaxID=2920878 RepID=UPI0023DE5D35|nr:STY4528 family pathogenicity island replication protein [Acidovorax sp. SUPP2539]GKS88723.1 helix-turn-helix domain-containing protein [Acidovorax sp. SUPP2539]